MQNKNTKSSTGRLSWMLSGVLKSKKAEGFVDTAIKMLIAVVIGALLLYGLYGLMSNVVIPTTTSKVSSLFNTTGPVEGGGGGGTGGGDTPVTPDPGVSRSGVIPDGATYTKADGTELEGNGSNTFPDTPEANDVYQEGDYTYVYRYDDPDAMTNWEVYTNEIYQALITDSEPPENTKAVFGEILSEIGGKKVDFMWHTFNNCVNLTVAPKIPDGVVKMYRTFEGCTALVNAPVIPAATVNMDGTFRFCSALINAPAIPNAVTSMQYTFEDCSALVVAPKIPASVIDMEGTFYGCRSIVTAPALPVDVENLNNAFRESGITAAPVIPESVTSMYATFMDCNALASAQTIPGNVTDMRDTFKGCKKLTGVVTINTNLEYSSCLDCFMYTVLPIKLNGTCSNLSHFVHTANNNNVTIE